MLALAQPGFSFTANNSLTYQLSRWERLLFDARFNAGGALTDQVGNVAEAIRQHHKPTMRKLESPDERAAAHLAVKAEAATFGAETFARLYNDPQKLENTEGWGTSAHQIADELPEWADLRKAVAGDPDFSALAASEVLRAISEKLPALLEAVDQEDSEEAGPGAGQGARSDQLGKAGQALRVALRAACNKAQDDVTQAREAMEGIAPGTAYAPPSHMQKDTQRLALAELLLKQPNLRSVLRKAGKLVRLAERTQATKDPRAKSVVVGVEQGADLARVLPSSLALLGHPLLKVLVYKGIAERSLPQYRLEGKTPQGKGPIVVLVDESYSMRGQGEQWAHAAVLACLQLGAKENREVAVVMFNHGISSAWFCPPSGVVETLSTISPFAEAAKPWGKRVDLALELCTRCSDGGTDFAAPLNWGIDFVEKKAMADLIFITDGQASANPETMIRLEKARTQGLRVFGLTVNGGSVTGEIRSICTEIVDIDQAKEVDQAIAKALPVRK